MTDLHTHILPGMDDGAKDVQESVTMLRAERDQGVDTVVLTPHFYRDQEDVLHFLQRRSSALEQLDAHIQQLPEQEQTGLPRMLLGAEVAWRGDLVNCEELHRLCIEGTKNLLLELPFTPWSGQMFNRIYDLMGRTGITPIIAHLERYLYRQRPEHIREVLQMGVPVQASGDILSRPLARRRTIKMLRWGQIQLLASDCHDCAQRKPNLKNAMDVVRHKLGDQRAEDLMHCADELVRA